MTNLKIKLPENFLEEEIRCDYKISSEMKKIWAVELDLLNEFITVCNKHNLTYFADSGTLLGAVRHKGFIPWDDDIDVVMLRSDFEKLKKVAPKEFTSPYFFQTEETDPGTLRGHAQLRNSKTTGILENERKSHYKFNQGIFIDIFPLDSIPDDKAQRVDFYSKLDKFHDKAFRYANYTSRYKKSQKKIKGFIKLLVHKCLPTKNFFYSKYEKHMGKYANKEYKQICKCFFYPHKDSYIWEKAWLDKTELVPFEMLQIAIPTEHVKVLDRMFGTNWREFIRGSSMHGNVFFDTDNSYLTYTNED